LECCATEGEYQLNVELTRLDVHSPSTSTFALYFLCLISCTLASEKWGCVQLMVMLPLVYVCLATFKAFFAINVGSLYALLPHSSSAFSLLSNSNLTARFAAPLCFNYLHVLSMDRPTKNNYYTVFAQRMGLTKNSTVAIPFLGVDFNRWAPWIILMVVALALMNAFGMCSQPVDT
jgi:hypothetical protein